MTDQLNTVATRNASGSAGSSGTAQPKVAPETLDSIQQRVLDEYLTEIADEELSLATIREQLFVRYSEAIRVENLWRKPVKDADDLKDWEIELNKAKHGFAQIPKPQGLTDHMITRVLLAREHIVVVDLVDGRGSTETGILGIYAKDGEHKGLYTTDTAVLYRMIQQLNAQLSSHAIKVIIEDLKNTAPLVPKTVSARYIPVNNGIFDHHEQQLMDFSPDFVFLQKSPVNYVNDAPNPTIIQPDGEPWDVATWIEDLSDDEGVPELLWEIISASLRPGVNFDQAAFLHSSRGNNGKGTYCSLIRNLVGPQSTTSIPMDKFSKPFALAGLVNATTIITDENPVGAFSRDLGDFKAIVTGDDFTLERKYKDPISLSFHGQVIQCVNDFPKSRDKSASYARRQLFIPFRKWFGGDGVERKYIKHDYLTRSDVLEYVLCRALSMTHTEFSNPPACQALLNQFQRENNPVVDFWLDMADEFVWDLLPTTFLYDLYKAWFDENHPSGVVVNRNDFLNHLRELLEGDPMWDGDDLSKQRRPGTMMDQPEPLIHEYNLRDWFNPNYKDGQDLDRKCVPLIHANKIFRGIVRRDPVVVDADEDEHTEDDA